MVHAKKERKQLDKLYAKTAFWLSLFVWIPLFNIALSIISIWLAVLSLRNISKEPDVYGGFWFSIIAIILSATSLITTVFAVVFYVISKNFCVA